MSLIISDPYIVMNVPIVIAFIYFVSAWVLLFRTKNVITQVILFLFSIPFTVFISNDLSSDGIISLYSVQITRYIFDDVANTITNTSTQDLYIMNLPSEFAYLFIMNIVAFLLHILNRVFDFYSKIRKS